MMRSYEKALKGINDKFEQMKRKFCNDEIGKESPMSQENIIAKFTGRFEDWLIESLKDKAKSIAYLRAHLDEYEKSDSDNDQYEGQSFEVFRSALENVLKAQSNTGESKEHSDYLMSKTTVQSYNTSFVKWHPFDG